MSNTDSKFKKGDLVQLNEHTCFTKDHGGQRSYPLTNHASDEKGIVLARRPITDEETRSWYDSDASKGMNDAGESKLPPQSTAIALYRSTLYVVTRGRAAIRLSYGNKTPGLVGLLDTVSGKTVYVKRELIRHA